MTSEEAQGAGMQQNLDIRIGDTTTGNTIAGGDVIETGITEACLQECAKHRTGEIDRVQASVNIISHIRKTSIRDEAIINGTIKTYLLIVEKNETDLQRELRAGVGTGTSGPEGEVPRRTISGKLVGDGPTKRRRIEVDSDSGDEADGFDEKELPWFMASQEREAQLPAKVLETRKLVLQYSKHFKKTKLSLLTSMQRPEFPESEWDNLLRNRPIDMDRVLTHFAFARNHRVTSTKLRTGEAPILKVVADHGTWLEVWSRVTAATVMLFPHRLDELNKYRTIISRFFMAGDPARVIVFDAAVRARVAARSDLLLTDIGDFQDLVMTHLHSGFGVAEFKQREREITCHTREPRKRMSETCNRFNSGTCPYSEATCRYRHICRVCRRTGHRQGDAECGKRPK